jgi:hypothetical protein
VEKACLRIFRLHQTGSSVKTILSAVSAAHTLGLLESKPNPLLWKLPVSADRVRNLPPHRSWLPVTFFLEAYLRCTGAGEFKLLGTAIVAFTLALRVSEAALLDTTNFAFMQGGCFITFRGSKRRPGEERFVRGVGTWVAAWCAFLHQIGGTGGGGGGFVGVGGTTVYDLGGGGSGGPGGRVLAGTPGEGRGRPLWGWWESGKGRLWSGVGGTRSRRRECTSMPPPGPSPPPLGDSPSHLLSSQRGPTLCASPAQGGWLPPLALQEFGLPTCLGKSPLHSPPPSPLGGLPPEEKKCSLRSFLWTLAYRVEKKLPGGGWDRKRCSLSCSA